MHVTSEKRRWIESLILALLMTLVFIFIFSPKFETNDDNAMAAISMGMRGTYNSHLVFINIILGKIISTLMRIIPFVKWYTVFHYAVLFVAFSVLFYSVMKLFETKKKLAYLLIGILILIWGYDCMVFVQFTKTAGICGAAGSLLIFTNLKKDKPRWGYTILGGILLLLCSMIRFQVFGLILLVSSLIGFFILLDCIKYKELKKVLPYLGVFSTILVFAVIMSFIDTNIYNAHNGWREYREYNHLRAELLDRGFPDYQENIEEYTKLGISEVDVENWNSWNFADKEAFTTDTMSALIALKSPKKISISFLLEFFREFFAKFIPTFLNEWGFYGFALILILWILYFKERKASLLGIGFLLIGINMYFYYKNRYLAYRVDTIMWLMFCIVIIYFMAKTSEAAEPDFKQTFFVLTLIALFSWKKDLIPSKDELQNKYNDKEYLDMVSEDDDNIYLVSVGSSPENNAYGIFDLSQTGLLDNYYSLGGWQTNSPLTNAVLANYQIENPYRDVIDHENAYLVDNSNIDLKIRYINQRYDDQAFAVLVKDIYENKIYRIATEQPEITIENIKKDNSVITSQMEYWEDFNTLYVSGYAFKPEENSWQQKFYTVAFNQDTQTHYCYYSTQKMLNGNYGIDQGKYAAYETAIDKNGMEPGRYIITQIVKINDILYWAGDCELSIQ